MVSTWRRALAVPALGLALAAGVASGDGGDDIEVAPPGATSVPGVTSPTATPDVRGGAQAESLDDVALGATVELSANLQDILGPNAFVLDGGDLNEETLVLIPSAITSPWPSFAADDDLDGSVEVVGEVVEVAVADLEDDGLFDFGTDEIDRLQDFDSERALVARSIQYVPDEVDADVDGDEVGTMVTIAGEIGEIISPRVFIVTGDEVLGLFGGAETPVIVPQGTRAPGDLAPGSLARVTGTAVRLVVVDVENDFLDGDFTDDERTALEEFGGDPAVILESWTIIEE